MVCAIPFLLFYTSMETLLLVLAVIAGIVGILGSVLPALPGPPLSWVGLLLMYLRGGTDKAGDEMSLTFLLIWLAVTIIVTVVDYIVPSYFTKITGGSKYAGWGAMVGLLLGIVVPIMPFGMIGGSIICAFLAELIFAKKDAMDSFKSAAGAFFGFLLGTGIKLISCALMMYYIFVYI